MMRWDSKWVLRGVLVALAAGLLFLAWRYIQPDPIDQHFAAGNGRVEAVEIDIAAKIAGRVKDILVQEGDFVTAGQTLAQMDTEVLASQRREAAPPAPLAVAGGTRSGWIAGGGGQIHRLSLYMEG